MNITDVRVRKISKEGKMKAVVSVTIDDEFVVHDIKVIEGDKGLFIAMPSRRSSDFLTNYFLYSVSPVNNIPFQFPECRWGYAVYFLKGVAVVVAVIIAAFKGDFRNAHAGFQKQFFRMINPHII